MEFPAILPPERYYEACVTYHLVRYFEDLYAKTLYPFSITQVQEKELGFDFGYLLENGFVFLLQFKRPAMGKDGTYSWRIGARQLESLIKTSLPVFYALPAFSTPAEWYEGLDKTYFIPAQLVRIWLQKQKGRESALLAQGDGLFSAVPENFFDPFGKNLHSALRAVSGQTEIQEKITFLQGLREEDREAVTGYWIEG